MSPNLSMGEFKALVQEYRLLAQQDVTVHALKYAYTQLQLGHSTPLLEKLDTFKKTDAIERRKKFESLNALPEVKEEPERTTREPINYKDPKMLSEVLHPKFNEASKKGTTLKALNLGKKYVIYECKSHGIALFRFREASTGNEGEERKVKMNMYCVICNILTQKHNREERIKDVQNIVQQVLSCNGE